MSLYNEGVDVMTHISETLQNNEKQDLILNYTWPKLWWPDPNPNVHLNKLYNLGISLNYEPNPITTYSRSLCQQC